MQFQECVGQGWQSGDCMSGFVFCGVAMIGMLSLEFLLCGMLSGWCAVMVCLYLGMYGYRGFIGEIS